MSSVVNNVLLEVKRWIEELRDIPYLWQGALGTGLLLWIWNSRRNRVSRVLKIHYLIVHLLAIFHDSDNDQLTFGKVNVPKYGGLLSFSSGLSNIRLTLEGLGPFQNAYVNVNLPLITSP
jgi:hypothetical protein